jgi:hypothetical protein
VEADLKEKWAILICAVGLLVPGCRSLTSQTVGNCVTIPEDIFNKKTIPIGVIIDLYEQSKIRISWASPYIDGGISFEVTPKQIVVYSHHDNPNPSYLYWVKNISDEQYRNIARYFASQEGKRWFEEANKVPEPFPDEVRRHDDLFIKDMIPFAEGEGYSWADLHQDYWAKLYCNISILLWSINSHLPSGVQWIEALPSDFVMKQRQVLIED